MAKSLTEAIMERNLFGIVKAEPWFSRFEIRREYWKLFDVLLNEYVLDCYLDDMLDKGWLDYECVDLDKGGHKIIYTATWSGLGFFDPARAKGAF